MLPKQHNSEPPLVATPRAKCGPGSKPEPGIQGRVPAGSAANGLTCNVTLIGHQGTSGGFKVYRYVDDRRATTAPSTTRRCCSRSTPFNLAGPSLGVAVLDMSDPAHPVQTDTLTGAADALAARVAEPQPEARPAGRGQRQPGHRTRARLDLRRPQRLPPPGAAVDGLVARFGHESGFSPDGKTFYATGTAPRRSPRSTSPTPRTRTRSGRATSSRTACRSATTATAPTSPTRAAATWRSSTPARSRRASPTRRCARSAA